MREELISECVPGKQTRSTALKQNWRAFTLDHRAQGRQERREERHGLETMFETLMVVNRQLKEILPDRYIDG